MGFKLKNCPQCGEKLILTGKDWAFCDNCVAEIEIEENNGSINSNTSEE